MTIEQLKNWLPLLSLIVAALAVLIGPYISWKVAKRQSETSVRITNKQIIAPMRQAWINSLRDLVAELLGKCAHYWAAGFEEREDAEYRHITEMVHRLELFINPREEDHSQLIEEVRQMNFALSTGSSKETEEKFWEAHRKVRHVAQTILKREWGRVKDEI